MEQLLVLDNSCNVCGKDLLEGEGLVSSEGVVVCGDACKNVFLSTKTPNLTVYSRVTGYLTPVSSWNKGKKAEFDERQRYKI